MNYIKSKAQSIILTTACILIGLQFIVGSLLDLVFGALVVGLLVVSGKVK